jgi:hypothetical protein
VRVDPGTRDIPIKSPLTSLCWSGDSLVDWAGGNRVIGLDCADSGPQVIWGYRFDAAVQHGRYAAIYERLGTKGVLLDRGEQVREINRSYYCADAYEYPIAFLEHAGAVLLCHCPDEYNRIEIEDAATGARRTQSANRNPDDFFHSRLALSPDGRRLLSAGWIWHPWDSISAWSVDQALADPTVLDKSDRWVKMLKSEVTSAAFVDADRVLLSASPDASAARKEIPDAEFGPGKLGVFNLESGAFDSIVRINEPVGTMMWIGDRRVVSFYRCPKVIDLGTGEVVQSWPSLNSGLQEGSIIHHHETLPHLALDPARRRFAVGAPDRITVVQL